MMLIDQRQSDLPVCRPWQCRGTSWREEYYGVGRMCLLIRKYLKMDV